MLLGVSTSVQNCRVAAYGNQVAWPGCYVRTLDWTADAGSLCHDGGPKSSITANDPSSWHQQTADLTMTSPRESLRNLNSKTLQNNEKLTIGTKHYDALRNLNDMKIYLRNHSKTCENLRYHICKNL